MKGNAKVIEMLNEILAAELAGINQYFVHAKLCQSWGYARLAEVSRRESIDEMKHADQIMERILHLGGMPNVQRSGKIRAGATVTEQFKLDLQLEREAVARLNKAIEQAVKASDNGNREMFEKILVSEEEHLDWLETQLELIKRIGEQNYLTQQMRAG